MAALRSSDVATLGCCSGHGKVPAYVDIAVRGLRGLRAFVKRLNRLQTAYDGRVLFDVSLNWRDDIATACLFEEYPSWIMLSLTVESVTGRGPTERLLAQIAESYRKASTAGAR